MKIFSDELNTVESSRHRKTVSFLILVMIFAITGIVSSCTEDDQRYPVDGVSSESRERPALNNVEFVWEQAELQRRDLIKNLTEKITAGSWGVGDDNVLRGPSGFSVDLNNCPEDWDNEAGITENEISFGQTIVKSGNLAAYGNITVGMSAYFDFINETGGIDDKKIKWISYDDGYVASQTIEHVEELIEADNVFAINNLGTPNGLAVYDKINSECIPQPFYLSGHPAFGDPENHPWTSSIYLSYSTEAMLWGTWIERNLADFLPVKVAALVMDNDFGLAYELGFKAFADENPEIISEFIVVRHDPAAPSVANEMTTIKASKPDVLISMTAGNPCLLAIQEAAATGITETLKAAFTPQVCKVIGAYMAPAGEAADGWWVVGGGMKDMTDQQFHKEPFINWARKQMTERGLDPNISLIGIGYGYAYPWVESLRIASELPGGLTRTNFILTVRSLNVANPMILDGIKTEFNGAADAFYIEGSDFSQFDANKQTWRIVEILDLNGTTPNCAYSLTTGKCHAN